MYLQSGVTNFEVFSITRNLNVIIYHVQSVYPLEVVRRRLQVGVLTPSDSVRTESAWRVFRSLTLRQLFSGLTATCLKVVPSAAISVLIRDTILGKLKR